MPAASGQDDGQRLFHIVHLKGQVGEPWAVYLRGQCVAQTVVRKNFQCGVIGVVARQQQVLSGNVGLGKAREFVEPRPAKVAGLTDAFAAKGIFIKSYEPCGIAGDDVGVHVAKHGASCN